MKLLISESITTKTRKPSKAKVKKKKPFQSAKPKKKPYQKKKAAIRKRGRPTIKKSTRKSKPASTVVRTKSVKKVDSTKKEAKKDSSGRTWWDRMSLAAKKKYLQERPSSKKAIQFKEEVAQRKKEGKLTEEDKELIPHLPNESNTIGEDRTIKKEGDQVAHLGHRERGIIANLLRVGKDKMISKLKDRTSVARTLLKFHNGHHLNGQDRENVKNALSSLAKVMLLSIAAVGIAVMAPAAIPDFVDRYLDSRTSESSSKSVKEERAVLCHYLDDMAKFLIDEKKGKF